MAEDPSRFAIACRQTGPVTLPEKLPKEESVFSESTSLIFKNTKVVRMFDAKRNTLVYVAIASTLCLLIAYPVAYFTTPVLRARVVPRSPAKKRNGTAVNVASYVGLNNIWRAELGDLDRRGGPRPAAAGPEEVPAADQRGRAGGRRPPAGSP